MPLPLETPHARHLLQVSSLAEVEVLSIFNYGVNDLHLTATQRAKVQHQRNKAINSIVETGNIASPITSPLRWKYTPQRNTWRGQSQYTFLRRSVWKVKYAVTDVNHQTETSWRQISMKRWVISEPSQWEMEKLRVWFGVDYCLGGVLGHGGGGYVEVYWWCGLVSFCLEDWGRWCRVGSSEGDCPFVEDCEGGGWLARAWKSMWAWWVGGMVVMSGEEKENCWFWVIVEVEMEEMQISSI